MRFISKECVFSVWNSFWTVFPSLNNQSDHLTDVQLVFTEHYPCKFHMPKFGNILLQKNTSMLKTNWHWFSVDCGNGIKGAPSTVTWLQECTLWRCDINRRKLLCQKELLYPLDRSPDYSNKELFSASRTDNLARWFSTDGC